MIRRFILRDSAIRTRAVEAVGECALSDPPLEVTIAPHRDKRSLSANSKLWALYARIAEHTGHDVQEVHDLMRARFLPRQYVRIEGRDYVVLQSTAKLNVAEFGTYLDQIEAFCAQEGIATMEAAT